MFESRCCTKAYFSLFSLSTGLKYRLFFRYYICLSCFLYHVRAHTKGEGERRREREVGSGRERYFAVRTECTSQCVQ